MARRLMYRGKRMAGATGRAMVKAGVLAGFAFFTNVWLHQHGINPSPAVTNNVAIGLAAAALHRRSGA